jgi:hypothetical protein
MEAQMDVASVLGMAQGLQALRLAQVRTEFSLGKLKQCQDLQATMVTQLLASLPGANPDGVGGKIDITV